MFGGLHLTNEERQKILKETEDKEIIKDIIEFNDFLEKIEKIMNNDEDYFLNKLSKDELIKIINSKIETIEKFPKLEKEELEISQEELYKIYLKVCEIENILKDIMKIKYNIK